MHMSRPAGHNRSNRQEWQILLLLAGRKWSETASYRGDGCGCCVPRSHQGEHVPESSCACLFFVALHVFATFSLLLVVQLSSSPTHCTSTARIFYQRMWNTSGRFETQTNCNKRSTNQSYGPITSFGFEISPSDIYRSQHRQKVALHRITMKTRLSPKSI